ncbi:hypothetical protein AVEN_125966-1 [Araneus ventricosus]|uniref:Uncharacterized protein n=1 Tax=Araneus ventricosus TaxID=182803 RepID=A0A4Y2A0L6_ARAVE|nr:hypothetical protein AVEN_125966-1 [Araneus ventricosus]
MWVCWFEMIPITPLELTQLFINIKTTKIRDDDAEMYKCFGYRFLMNQKWYPVSESSLASLASYNCTQTSRLRPPTRCQFLDILSSRISPSRELKAFSVSYSRIRLASSDLLSRPPPDSE